MLMYSILTVVQYTVQDCVHLAQVSVNCTVLTVHCTGLYTVHWAQVSVNCKPVFKFFMKYKLVATLFCDIEVKNPL